jgi:hypothetical protein
VKARRTAAARLVRRRSWSMARSAVEVLDAYTETKTVMVHL